MKISMASIFISWLKSSRKMVAQEKKESDHFSGKSFEIYFENLVNVSMN